MIALLITVIGSLTLLGSVAYLIYKNVDNNKVKSLNPSESQRILEYHEDPDAFRCRIDPMKDVYFINVDTLNYINKISELCWINRYGQMHGLGSSESRAIVSNSKDDLKDMISDILKERIMDPDYPKSIRIDFRLPDKFVGYTSPYSSDMVVIDSSDVAELTKILDRGCIKVKTYNGDTLTTWLETYDEYMDKQNELKRKSEESRLNGILNQLENINKL